MEDRSVKRDKTEGELVVSHLVRHLVSAQPVIIVSAEAGVSLINQDISVCLSVFYSAIIRSTSLGKHKSSVRMYVNCDIACSLIS